MRLGGRGMAVNMRIIASAAAVDPASRFGH
jgi:hypothetical protein